MRHSTNNTSSPCHTYYPCPCPKNWSRPLALMTARGNSRRRFHYRLNFVYLTETCPVCPPPATSTDQFHTLACPRNFFYPNWRLRWPKPNPTPQDFSLLFNRPPRLNNPSLTIFTITRGSNPYYLLHHNILCFPYI